MQGHQEFAGIADNAPPRDAGPVGLSKDQGIEVDVDLDLARLALTLVARRWS